MAMTKKDYERAAKIVKRQFEFVKTTGMTEEQKQKCEFAAETVMECFITFFKQSGGAFNTERFTNVCKGVRSIGKVGA